MTENRISLIIAYHNEEAIIAETIRSLLAQTDKRFQLVLVDNMSTDASTQRARETVEGVEHIPVTFIQEQRRGQLVALAKGLELADTQYVATIDADTYYPPEYVERAIRLLEDNPTASAALAYNVGEDRRRKTGGLKWLSSLMWPNKCQAGGAGHCYRLSAYKAAGGFDPERWPYVLFDHEIAHRLRDWGPFAYERKHVIYASERADGSTARSWGLFDRLLYKLLPLRMMDWFFYRFLGSRLEARGLRSVMD